MQTMQRGRELVESLNGLYPFPQDLGVVKCNSIPDEDWSGDPAIFFYITLADESANSAVFRDTTRKIEKYVTEKIDPLERFGRLTYFYYRSKSEQAIVRDEHYV